jgi:holo-[acyl-carrier-protein] synthase
MNWLRKIVRRWLDAVPAISRDNLLDWLLQQTVMAGMISGRGFLDVRMDFSDSMTGSVRITKLNSKNVMIESDGTEYDPDSWNDVVITKWLTVDDIEATYGKEKAEYLRNGGDTPPQDTNRDASGRRERFGNDADTIYTTDSNGERKGRFIRVVEHQHKKIELVRYFVDLNTGDLERVPPNWDEQKEQAHLAEHPGFAVIKRPGKRIRWTVVADNVLLHDDKAVALNYLAKRFCAKEALLKAMGTGMRPPFEWGDAQLLNDEKGKPYFLLGGMLMVALSGQLIHVSVSDHSDVVIGSVIIEKSQDV